MTVELRWVLALAAVAGGYAEVVRRTVKQLNGIGGRLRKFERNVITALIAHETDERKREWLANHFREP